MSNEKVEEKNTKKVNKITNYLIIIVIILLSIFMYSKYVETNYIRVKEYLITKKEIPVNFNGVNIVYISDILYGSVDLEYLKDLVNRINEMKPDIILFGGGLVSSDYKISDEEKKSLIEELNKIGDNLGKYYILSNNDKETTIEILESVEFKSLINTSELIYNKENTPICLIGIGSYNKGDSQIEKLAECENYYTIMFTHEPDVIDKVISNDYKTNMILAGNTLGGEVNIPIYGNLIKYKGSKKYYKNEYHKNNIDIYISSGIGTDKLGLRLFNPPSFNFFRLKSTD